MVTSSSLVGDLNKNLIDQLSYLTDETLLIAVRVNINDAAIHYRLLQR